MNQKKAEKKQNVHDLSLQTSAVLNEESGYWSFASLQPWYCCIVALLVRQKSLFYFRVYLSQILSVAPGHGSRDIFFSRKKDQNNRSK